jgi:hypothetical protein
LNSLVTLRTSTNKTEVHGLRQIATVWCPLDAALPKHGSNGALATLTGLHSIADKEHRDATMKCESNINTKSNKARRSATGAACRDAPAQRRWSMALGAGLAWAAPAVHASFLSGDALDTMADIMAVVVLIFVPVVVVYLFWMVHILPEKIAEKRHHPQKDAIKTLCMLSLFFGGLLWPLAWLWAYSKPVMYKLAYGTDKHEDYFKDAPPDAVQPPASSTRDAADALATSAADAATLDALRRRLAALEARLGPASGRGASD